MTFRRVGVILTGLAAIALGCPKSSHPPPPPQCTGGSSAVSGLPLPKGCVDKPVGTAGNLRVLPWAGFKGAVSFTFDDAVPSQIQNYATLNAPGVRSTFYVSPSQVEKTDPENNSLLPRWKQVLADGHEIGGHTLNHCALDLPKTFSNCAWGTPEADPETVEHQVSGALDYVKDVLGQKDALGRPAVWTMATPYGDDDYRQAAIDAGLLANRNVWTNQPASYVAPGDVSNIFNLPTWAGGGASGGWGIDTQQSSIEKIINDARGRGRWTTLLFHDVAPREWDGGYNCCAVPAVAIAGAMKHLKDWGDVWGDAVVNVASYTIAQNLFASLTPVDGDGGAKTWTWTLPSNFPPGKYLRVSVDGGTLTQSVDGQTVTLPWNPRGFYEVALSAGNLTLTP